MSGKYKNTIDWDLFWKQQNASEIMVKGGKNMAKRIGLFIDKYEIGTIADFGCGPGITLFILADKYPDLNFVGFDPSLPVIKQNQLKAKQLGLSNIRFDYEMLPEINSVDTFDLIYCIATLHYVENIKEAIQSLYAHINDGGLLIFNYPNRYSLFAYRKWIKPDDLENKKRFSLVLNERNLLTLEEINQVLGKRPKNFWKAVGEGSSRENNCIYVQKK